MSYRTLTEGSGKGEVISTPSQLTVPALSINTITSGGSNVSINKSTQIRGSLSILSSVGDENAFVIVQGSTALGSTIAMPCVLGTAQPITSGVVAVSINTTSGLVGYNSSVKEAKMNFNYGYDDSFLYRLKPCQYNYRKQDTITKKYLDEPIEDTSYGLIAEDVELINDNLCCYDGKGKLITVNYMLLISPLIKCVQEQRILISDLQKQVSQLMSIVSPPKI